MKASVNGEADLTSASARVAQPLRGLGIVHPALIKAAELKSEWKDLCTEFLPHCPRDSPWRYSQGLPASYPDRGWKIHLSATILTACDTLRAVGPFLKKLDIPYKAPKSLDQLRKINSGIWYGYTQVGKFITVYASDPETFKDLCESLLELTLATGTGPEVPFDNKFHPQGNVYYRYGSFRERTPAQKNDLLTNDDSAIRDVERASSLEPLRDPFEQRDLNSRVKPFSDRYQVFRALSQRGKGGVYEAIDIYSNPPRVCVIKEGRRHGETGWDGRDGFIRNKNEATVLSALSETIRSAPHILDTFDHNDRTYLVLEKIEGVNVQRILDHLGGRLEVDLAMHICLELTRLVTDIHGAGFVWRDLKPENLILERDGRLRAIDFEGACSINEFDPFIWSTPNFSPPEVSTGSYLVAQSSNLSEDLFALGCCLYLLLERKMPNNCENTLPGLTFDRILDGRVRRIIQRLLSRHPEDRPAATEAYHAFLRSDQGHLS